MFLPAHKPLCHCRFMRFLFFINSRRKNEYEKIILLIGFEESITCSRTNEWLIDFFEGLADGYTVNEICSLLAEREYYADAHLDSYVICGNKNAKFAN